MEQDCCVLPFSPAAFFRRIRQRIEALGFDLAATLIRALGPDRASRWMGWAWRHLAPFNHRHPRARAHLAASLPAIDAAGREAIIGAMWDNLGRTTAESFHIGTLIGDETRFILSPETHAAIAKAKASGAVFVSLHQGNWELAAPILHAHGLAVAGVYQKIQNPLIDARATAARAPFYALGLHAKGVDAARNLMKIAGNGGTVTIMADLRDLAGVYVPFFGRPAPSNAFPALLARGRNVPLFAGVVLREVGATFRVEVREIAVARSADRDADLLAITAEIQRVFEDFIRAHPGQWMWGHRRWQR